MKKIIFSTRMSLIACFLFVSVSLLTQTTYTVNNNAGASTNFTDLQTAINTVATGSILYIQQSATSYGNIIINKSITLIGRSHSDSGFKSEVGTVYFTPSSSNTIIKGLKIGNIGESGSSATINNISIFDNSISGIGIGNTHNFDNVFIQGNVLDGTIYLYSKTSNVLITNNLVFCNSLWFYKTNTLLLSNNIFGYPGLYIYNNGTDLLNISNCIFICNYGGISTIHLNPQSGTIQVNNCISYNYNTTYTYSFTTGVGITINGNVQQNTNPLFTNAGLITPGIAHPNNYTDFDPTNDNLTLQVGSPVTDAGIFEGYNFKNFGTPAGCPSIKVLSNSATVPKNGNLSVTIEAKIN